MFSENENRIFIGVGANLASALYDSPLETCRAALREVEKSGVRVLSRSRFFESAPVPVSDQPWYVNAVAEIASSFSAEDTLAILHGIEDRFGRVRRVRNEARVLDLDLLAFGNTVSERDGGLVLPHPRMHQRAFVLLPLLDIAADWRHPVTGMLVTEMIAALPADQICRPCA